MSTTTNGMDRLSSWCCCAWQPDAHPADLLDEWVGLTFPGAEPAARALLHGTMDRSLRTYEDYTAPLGVGWMVRPGHHYGPVDGYEYTVAS